MAYFYGYRIVHEVINPKTGLAWTIADVPTKWVAATQAWIEEHTN